MLTMNPFLLTSTGGWLLEFVRESNRLAGIMREPARAELAAHRGLLAASTLKVENLERFVHHLECNAILRSDNEDERSTSAGMYSDLETVVLAAQERLRPPRQLHGIYRSLRPFTDANGRSARALWLWQLVKTTVDRAPEDSERSSSRRLHYDA